MLFLLKKTSFVIGFMLLNISLLAAADQPQLVFAKKTPIISSSLSNYLNTTKELQIPVWIFFTDKGISSQREYRRAVEAAAPQLTQRALARRKKVMKGELLTFEDLPVHDAYIVELKNQGFEKRHNSKWLNAVSGFLPRNNLSAAANLPFVREISLLHKTRRKPQPQYDAPPGEKPSGVDSLDYGNSFQQLQQINVPAVQELGYTGKGVIICMLDVGFNLSHEALQHIDKIAEHDFIFDDDTTSNQEGDAPTQQNHGTETLSVIGGAKAGKLYGPAYEASFILAKTEDVRSETPIEEDNWVAAIEWAEGLGADVSSTSLGYYDWYTYEDMDGNTSVMTRAADLAVARGVVVVVAAGNERNSTWHYIGAPADGDSVISVGAVNSSGVISSFSSAGPTFDGRIKPEVVAMGVGVRCADPYDAQGYRNLSGTSFACPLTAGVAALLVQAHPTWTPMQVREALMLTADRADNPDNLYGWGLVDALAALKYRQKGDVDGNDLIDDNDVVMAGKIALNNAGFEHEAVIAADLNGDGQVDVLDVVKLARKIKN